MTYLLLGTAALRESQSSTVQLRNSVSKFRYLVLKTGDLSGEGHRDFCCAAREFYPANFIRDVSVNNQGPYGVGQRNRNSSHMRRDAGHGVQRDAAWIVVGEVDGETVALVMTECSSKCWRGALTAFG